MSDTLTTLKKMLQICKVNDRCDGCPLEEFCVPDPEDVDPVSLEEAAEAIDWVELDEEED